MKRPILMIIYQTDELVPQSFMTEHQKLGIYSFDNRFSHVS